MPLDPEEFKRRRQAEQKKRAEKLARQRKLMLQILAAAAVLLSVIILIVAFIVGGKKAKKKPVQETPAEPNLTTIHLAATGDLNVTNMLVDTDGTPLDYEAVFMDVAHLLAGADVTVVNLEGVASGEPYGDSRSAPKSMLQALASNGVDLIQLANSYSMYKGVYGLATTIDNVRSVGMEPLGVFKDQEEFENSGGFTLCEVQGIKIAFVSFTKGMDGMSVPGGSESCVNLLYTDYKDTYQEINTDGITAVLEAVEKEAPDITVAMLHWGSKRDDLPSESQEQIRALMEEGGVDAIIGTHSQFVQKMELKDGKFVAYSLGEFVSTELKAGTEYSVILDLEITKNNDTGETVVSNFSYTPIFTVVQENRPVRIMRIRETMSAYESGYIERVSDEIYTQMGYALERIDSRIKGE